MASSLRRTKTLRVATVDLIDRLAEQQIQAAIDRGELSGLPGEGRPLPQEDLSMVPEHLRAGYRLLKNAGYLPPEVVALREIRDAEALLARIRSPEELETQRRRQPAGAAPAGEPRTRPWPRRPTAIRGPTPPSLGTETGIHAGLIGWAAPGGTGKYRHFRETQKEEREAREI